MIEVVCVFVFDTSIMPQSCTSQMWLILIINNAPNNINVIICVYLMPFSKPALHIYIC